MHTMRHASKAWATVLVGMFYLAAGNARADDSWIVFEGKDGPGQGKHVVFVTGDEEYRSEDSMPQLAKVLAVRHGFKCTVLFSINKETGEIDPKTVDNIPGLEALETSRAGSADAVLLDVMLPEMDGVETCRRLKGDNGRSLPVVIVTALDNDDCRRRGAEAGADAYFVKPFDPDEVVEVLRKLIGCAGTGQG